ncbi:MAG: tripartite tricarboxylate transporter TctB family protein [Treponema sp.]|nr:tripartite tricarboxylate transporter TctB family protein [Treponema sp.]
MELIFSLILGVILLFGLGTALRIPPRTVGTDVLKAGGFPIGVIVLSLAALGFLISQYVRRCKKEGKPLFAGKGMPPKVIAIAALICVYAALMNVIGFALSTLAFTLANPLVMGYKKYRALALFSVLLTVVVVLVFGKIFFIPLPRGLGFLRELSYYIY